MSRLSQSDLAHPDSYRKRARRWYVLPRTCEDCQKKPPTDRHHKDGDVRNNTPENIAFLCRTCHMQADGRLEAFAASNPQKQPPKPCVICGELSKPLRRGRCHRCAEYLNKTGVERPEYLWNGRTSCKRGHPYSEGSMFIDARGARQCRICAKLRKRKYREKGRC